MVVSSWQFVCRFKTFNEESMPVVEKYASQGKAHKISAVPPPEEVFLEVERLLQPVFAEDTFTSETVAVQSASVVSNAQPTIMYSKRPSANWVGFSHALHAVHSYHAGFLHQEVCCRRCCLIVNLGMLCIVPEQDKADLSSPFFVTTNSSLRHTTAGYENCCCCST